MDANSRRIITHPVLGPLPDAETLTFTFNGQPLSARAGDVVAAALMANGGDTVATAARDQSPPAVYCAIGHCFACQMTVDDRSGVRTCLTLVREGMRVESGGPTPGSARTHVRGS